MSNDSTGDISWSCGNRVGIFRGTHVRDDALLIYFSDTHEIDDFLTPEQSVNGMISTIIIRTPKESGSFWTWQGKVSLLYIPIFLS